MLHCTSKYNKTISQVVLRWHIQRGVIAIPKSVHEERIYQNFNVWDFRLNAEDMEAVASMDTKQGLVINRDSSEFAKNINGLKIHE